MKINNKLLAFLLGIFHPWWISVDVNAFSIPIAAHSSTTTTTTKKKKKSPSSSSSTSSSTSTRSSTAILHASSAWDLFSISPSVVRIEGRTRRTYKFPDVSQEVVQVAMNSGGRPINADVELWIGPDWTPMKINSFSEDGKMYPIQTLVGTRNKPATVEIRNTGPPEYPLSAACSYAMPALTEDRRLIPQRDEARYVEGGSVYSVPFPGHVKQAKVMLSTGTRQLNAHVELLNGPNNVKQKFEVFTNNGMLNSLYIVFNTPGGDEGGGGNVVRIRNLASQEFPCMAYVSENRDPIAMAELPMTPEA